MASKFLKKNFPSMNEEDKDKLNNIKGSVSNKELEFIKESVPNVVSSIASFQKLLEEDK